MKYFVVLILVIPAFIFSQTRYVMNNGQRYVAYLSEASNDELRLELLNKTRLTIKKNQINTFEDFYVDIKFIDGMKIKGHIDKVTKDSIFGRNEEYLPFVYSRKEIKFIDDNIDIYDQTYSFLGGSVLVPGAINFIYGMHLNKTIGYRISVGTFPNAIIGIQSDLLFSFANWSLNFN